MRVLCAIPCYNESHNLPAVFADLRERSIGDIADILFVDDCSTDHSAEMIQSHGFKLIRHERNMGYGQAVKSGFRHALDGNYDGFVVFPGDHQRSAADLARLIQLHEQSDFDVIIGSKFHMYSESQGAFGPFTRRIGNVIYRKIARCSWGSPVQDVLAGFKICRVQAVKPFIETLPSGYPFDICFSLYACRFGLRMTEIDVQCRYDAHTSKMKSVLWVSFGMLCHLVYHYVAQSFICPVPQALNAHRRTRKALAAAGAEPATAPKALGPTCD